MSVEQAQQLIEAVESGDCDQLAELVAGGIPVTAKDDDGNTALHFAAQGEMGCVDKLLELGAEVNAVNNDGATPLIEAVKYGDYEISKSLLDKGADKSLKTADGETALSYANEGGDSEIIGLLGGEARAEETKPEPELALKPRRNSVSSESVDPNAKIDLSQIPREEKDEAATARIKGCMHDNFLFKALDAATLKIVIDSMSEVKKGADERVITQGEDGDYFYVVESGALDCFVQPDKAQWGKELGNKVLDYSAGNSFGELALMYNTPRAASIVATTAVILWAMDRNTFRTIVMQRLVERRTKLEALIKKAPVFASMDANEQATISDAFEPASFGAGTEICAKGGAADAFYVVVSGEVVVSDPADEGGAPLKSYGEADYFGEVALLMRGSRTATVKAVTDCECVAIDKAAFHRLMKPVLPTLEANLAKYKVPPTSAAAAASATPAVAAAAAAPVVAASNGNGDGASNGAASEQFVGKVRGVLFALLERTCKEKPDNVRAFAVEHLAASYPEEAKEATKPASALGVWAPRADVASTEAALQKYLIDVDARPLLMAIVEKALRAQPTNVIAFFIDSLHEA